MRTTKLLVILAFLFMPLIAGADTSDWIPITIKDGKLRIPSSFAGIDGCSIIDTGADQSAINRRFLSTNHLPLAAAGEITVKGMFKKQKRPIYKNLSIKLLGMQAQFPHLPEVSLGSAQIQMLIGGDFLEQFIFQFDYPNQRMRWLTRDTMDLHSLSNIPSRKDKQTAGVLVKVLLNGRQSLWVTVDTGAKSGLWIERSFAARKGWLTASHTNSRRASGVNASGAIQQFRLPSVKLGEFESTNTLVSVPGAGQKTTLFERTARPGSKIQRSASKSRGLLGWDVLKDFVVTIDYRIGKIHLDSPTPA
jgi:hypothetical protein